MRRAFLTLHWDRQFPHATKSASIGSLVKAAPMMPDSEFLSAKPAISKSEAVARPRPSDYFWRPWYAKLWWFAAAVFWFVTAVATWVVPGLAKVLPDSIMNSLVLALHPFVIVPVLGFPALWAWRQSVTFPWDPGYDGDGEGGDLEKELYGGESIGFGRRLKCSDTSDPTDPASPLNPANPLYRLHHGEL